MMQTGQYSTQIFSLAVLLSSLFVYNQMGGIDEAAIDHLSLVTEMTKHIRIKADSAGERQSAGCECSWLLSSRLAMTQTWAPRQSCQPSFNCLHATCIGRRVHAAAQPLATSNLAWSTGNIHVQCSARRLSGCIGGSSRMIDER